MPVPVPVCRCRCRCRSVLNLHPGAGAGAGFRCRCRSLLNRHPGAGAGAGMSWGAGAGAGVWVPVPVLVPVVMQESTFYGPLTCTGNTGTFNQFSCFFQEQKSFFMIKLVIFGILHLIIFHTCLCKFFLRLNIRFSRVKLMLIFFTSCIFCFIISFWPKSRAKDIFTRAFFAFHSCKFDFFFSRAWIYLLRV